MIIPIALIAVGLFLFAKAIGFDVAGEGWTMIWALVLVALGLAFLSHRNWGHACSDKDCWRCCEVSMSDGKSKKKRK